MRSSRGPSRWSRSYSRTRWTPGQTQITVEIREGGVGLIRVADDGHGIPADELPLAFHRHATSKLNSAEELDRVSTLGFRGEALPSIAAVSNLSVLTRTREETVGSRRVLQWGEMVDAGSEGCAAGTIIEVSDLFGNQPARRKFLRSAQAETARVQELVSRYSLAFPEVRFRLVNDGRTSLTTPGNGQPREALLSVYGSQVAQSMLDVDGEDAGTGYTVEGFAAAPNISRANRTYLTFFVNRRLVQSRMLSFAVEEAYAGLLQVKRYPVAAINLVIPHSEVDVNSHPAKREVRFHHENRVFSLTQKAVRAALMSDSPVPSASPYPASGQGSGSRLFAGGNGRPWSRAPALSGRGGVESTATDESQPSFGETLPLLGRPAVPLKVVGQLKQTYIVAEGPEGMFLIDQHAAHERTLYDRICADREERKPASQPLLAPVNVELTPTHSTTLLEHMQAVADYGFQLEPFGERSYLLRAVPSILSKEDPAKGLIDILDLATLEGLTRQKEDLMAASIACHAAIRAGQPLSDAEMRALLEQLEASANPHTCPHGRPTMVHFSAYHVEREFGRR